jgi:hypothetical protein
MGEIGFRPMASLNWRMASRFGFAGGSNAKVVVGLGNPLRAQGWNWLTASSKWPLPERACQGYGPGRNQVSGGVLPGIIGSPRPFGLSGSRRRQGGCGQPIVFCDFKRVPEQGLTVLPITICCRVNAQHTTTTALPATDNASA